MSSVPLPAGFPSLAEVLEKARVVSIPTRTSFRGITQREAVIFAGSVRWSEFSPFLEYSDAEAVLWLRAALEFGWSDLAKTRLERVVVNATVPAVQKEDVADVLRHFPGCRTVKVKVAQKGQTLADDVARVAAVRKEVGDAALIRLDANAAWSFAAAKNALKRLRYFDLDYVEQPVAKISELAQLRQIFVGEVKIAADESVRKTTDPLAVAKAQAADVLVLKAQPMGGVNRAIKIIREAGLPVVISSALDTSVGVSMGAHLAASLEPGELYGACGLGTVALLAGDVTHESLLPENGFIPVQNTRVSEDLLAKFAAPSERVHWWRQRITRCFELL